MPCRFHSHALSPPPPFSLSLIQTHSADSDAEIDLTLYLKPHMRVVHGTLPAGVAEQLKTHHFAEHFLSLQGLVFYDMITQLLYMSLHPFKTQIT